MVADENCAGIAARETLKLLGADEDYGVSIMLNKVRRNAQLIHALSHPSPASVPGLHPPTRKTSNEVRLPVRLPHSANECPEAPEQGGCVHPTNGPPRPADQSGPPRSHCTETSPELAGEVSPTGPA